MGCDDQNKRSMRAQDLSRPPGYHPGIGLIMWALMIMTIIGFIAKGCS